MRSVSHWSFLHSILWVCGCILCSNNPRRQGFHRNLCPTKSLARRRDSPVPLSCPKGFTAAHYKLKHAQLCCRKRERCDSQTCSCPNRRALQSMLGTVAATCPPSFLGILHKQLGQLPKDVGILYQVQGELCHPHHKFRGVTPQCSEAHTDTPGQSGRMPQKGYQLPVGPWSSSVTEEPRSEFETP